MFKINIPKPSSTRSRIKLTTFEGGLNLKKSENIMPMTYAFTTYNFSHTRGALEAGLGIADLSSAIFSDENLQTQVSIGLSSLGSIIGSFHAKRYNQETLTREDKLMFLTSDMKLHYLPLNPQEIEENASGIKTISNLMFSAKPTAINYRLNGQDCTIFSSILDPMIVWGLTENVMKVADAPHISSMAMHYERLFATVDGEQSSIWFSDDLDPTNWSVSLTEAGFIEMLDERGALKKVLSFNDYIYVFRDYGITRISAIADQTTFSVAHLFVASGKIYPNTVISCGDVILFLASDGLYKFDGVSCSKILTNIENGFSKMDNTYAIAGYFENKYYIACSFNFQDELMEGESEAKNNCLIEVDLNTMQAIFLRGTEIVDINTVLSDYFCGVVVSAKQFGSDYYRLGVIDHSGKVFNNITHKVWKTALTDLGYPQKQKCVRNIFINSKSDCKIIVTTEENNKKELQVKASNKPISISTRIYGAKFSFEFSCDSDDCEITNPNIIIKMDNRY